MRVRWLSTICASHTHDRQSPIGHIHFNFGAVCQANTHNSANFMILIKVNWRLQVCRCRWQGTQTFRDGDVCMGLRMRTRKAKIERAPQVMPRVCWRNRQTLTEQTTAMSIEYCEQRARLMICENRWSTFVLIRIYPVGVHFMGWHSVNTCLGAGQKPKHTATTYTYNWVVLIAIGSGGRSQANFGMLLQIFVLKRRSFANYIYFI